MSNAIDQPIEDVTNRVDEAALGAFASGVNMLVNYPLQVGGLEKFFGDITAINGATFEAESGTPTGFIDPNRAGKSTTFNFIMGMLKPDAGTIALNGGDITGEEPYQIANRGVVRTL